MGDSGESLRARLRMRWPAGGAGIAAAVFVGASLLAGGAGGAVHTTMPELLRIDEAPIVDPVEPPSTTPAQAAVPRAQKEAATVTTVTASWAAPAPPLRRSGGGGGGGGGSAVLDYTNAARAANGLAGLAWNGTLASRSCAWAAHLAEQDGELAHSSNGGGFGWWGENVASGYGNAAAVVDGWMGSSGHRANILRPQFTVMGSCSATSSTGRIYWVQQFGG